MYGLRVHLYRHSGRGLLHCRRHSLAVWRDARGFNRVFARRCRRSCCCGGSACDRMADSGAAASSSRGVLRGSWIGGIFFNYECVRFLGMCKYVRSKACDHYSKPSPNRIREAQSSKAGKLSCDNTRAGKYSHFDGKRCYITLTIYK